MSNQQMDRKPSSAKSSCCGAEYIAGTACQVGNDPEWYPVCSKCDEPDKKKLAPDEGEMRKLIDDLESLSAETCKSSFSGPPTMGEIQAYEDNADRIVHIVEKSLPYIRSLQSRLKQAEAERDSYRGDAEKMARAIREAVKTIELPNSGIVDTIWVGEGMTLVDLLLSSLSNQYPSSHDNP